MRKVPTYCYQCVAGPDLLTVKVCDGVATEVEPNFAAAATLFPYMTLFRSRKSVV